MRTVPPSTPTPETVDNHKRYGSLKLQAGLGAGIAIAFFGSAFASEGWDIFQTFGGIASAFWAAGRNSTANQLADTIEQQVLTSYVRTHFKSGNDNTHPHHNLSAEGRPLKDVTPQEQRAPAI